MNDLGDKAVEETQEQQTQKKIIDLEQRCHEQIKEYERSANSEMNSHIDQEKRIHQQRLTPNEEELFTHILNKSITSKARDKMK